MLIELLKPNFVHSDERGTLTQLVREGYRQINVVETKAGAYRGGHYHKNNDEAFFVLNGKLKLTATNNNVSESYTFSAGDMFLIPPLVSHSFEYYEDTILVVMYDKGVEYSDGTKDILSAE